MKSLTVVLALAAITQASPTARARRQALNSTLETDLNIISRYWGQISPYADNAENFFGVVDVGLPDGCQVEQAHSLQRHAQRFPTSAFDDGLNDLRFAAKVTNWTSVNSTELFTGPLAFLNSYQNQLGSGYLTGIGAQTEFQAGVTFWNRYGRTLYNATVGQTHYNASFDNGTARPKPVLRTTSQSRIENSQISWALGFFGPSYNVVPDPTIANFSTEFNVVIIPEGGTENNTLASYDSCFNDDNNIPGSIGDYDLEYYIPLYLADATARMNKYAPAGFSFSLNDTYAMQSICAYENAYLGQSDFCIHFTEVEWAGFEATLDQEYFYDFSFGNPTGRAQGIGYVQELLARLQNEYITVSNSSVNSSITDNAESFPLGQPFYADFSHDDIIISVLTALSIDYFDSPVSLTQFPPDPDRPFILSHLTPFGGRLITEVIGCSASDPTPVPAHRTQYYPTQYGYDPENAPHKFIRLRLNNGILPLSSIRGGACEGRTDGLCAKSDFLRSQANAYDLSNYDYVCFGNHTVENALGGQDFDGTLFE